MWFGTAPLLAEAPYRGRVRLLSLVFRLRSFFRLQLHVARRIRATGRMARRHDVCVGGRPGERVSTPKGFRRRRGERWHPSHFLRCLVLISEQGVQYSPLLGSQKLGSTGNSNLRG